MSLYAVIHIENPEYQGKPLEPLLPSASENKAWRCQLQRYGNKIMDLAILRDSPKPQGKGSSQRLPMGIRDNINDDGIVYSL